jgi:deazaflavin-dependent oxidoreductase (nitroreductase family)
MRRSLIGISAASARTNSACAFALDRPPNVNCIGHQDADEARPRLGRRMARFNRLVANRLTTPFAERLPGLGIVIHVGRRSGRTYRTPVLLFSAPAGYVIALTYGRDAEWVKNVLAAGGCRVLTRRRELHLTRPEVVRDEDRRPVPAGVRPALALLRVRDFLRLHE